MTGSGLFVAGFALGAFSGLPVDAWRFWRRRRRERLTAGELDELEQLVDERSRRAREQLVGLWAQRNLEREMRQGFLFRDQTPGSGEA